MQYDGDSENEGSVGKADSIALKPDNTPHCNELVMLLASMLGG